jgi:hypothetical protein
MLVEMQGDYAQYFLQVNLFYVFTFFYIISIMFRIFVDLWRIIMGSYLLQADDDLRLFTVKNV